MATVRLEDPKYSQIEMWVVSHLQIDLVRQKCGLNSISARVPLIIASPQGNCLKSFFWLSLRVMLSLGRLVFFHLLGISLETNGSLTATRNSYYLSTV